MGELSAETLKSRGVRGYIVDGGCRDSSFIEKLGFPVFCKFFTSVDIVGKWIPDAFEIDIRIGDVTIQNGDYVMADRDSTVIIPHGLIDKVISTAEEMVTTENTVRLAILKGVDPVEAYLKYRKF
jgi:4-hydroxy-4-methyl-2-oxoglutarate aldolase